jgi:hypothetical protein
MTRIVEAREVGRQRRDAVVADGMWRPDRQPFSKIEMLLVEPVWQGEHVIAFSKAAPDNGAILLGVFTFYFIAHHEAIL